MNIDNLKDYKIKNDYLYSLELIRLFYDIVAFLLLICTICFIAYNLDKLPEASHTEMTEIRLRGRGEATIIVGIFFIFLFIKTNHIKRLRFVKNNDFYISVDKEKIYFETYTVDKEGLFDIAKSYKKVSETINKSDIVFRLQTKRPALAYSHIFDKDTYNTKEIENKSLNYRLDYRVARIIFFPIIMFFAILNILSSYLILFLLNGKNLKTYTIYQTKTKLVSLPFVDDLSVYFLYTEYRLKHSAISKGAYEIEHREEAQPLGEKYIAKQRKKIEKILNKKKDTL